MSPLDTGASRHYAGPDAPQVPPPVPVAMPELPPAEDLLATEEIPPASQRVVDSIEEAFDAWQPPVRGGGYTEQQLHELLFSAFKAGVAWHARSLTTAARATKPTDALEGTPESRTLVAALSFFIDQVLIHHPEEVQSGEWLTATDATALIDTLRRT